jgi:hypothetical protein
MLGWTTGRFRTINKDQFATPTDRLLSGSVRNARIGRGSVPAMNPATEIINLPRLAHVRRPSAAFGTLVFLIGGVLGFSVVTWPF